MNVEKHVIIGPYRAVIGWRDETEEYYSYLEKAQGIDPPTLWEYKAPEGRQDMPLRGMVASTQQALKDLANREGFASKEMYSAIDQFGISTTDYRHLINAPLQRSINPAGFDRHEMLDTEYAERLVQRTSAERQEQQQSCLRVLLLTAVTLEHWQNGPATLTGGQQEAQQIALLDMTVAAMIQLVPEIASQLSWEELAVAAQVTRNANSTCTHTDSQFSSSTIHAIDAYVSDVSHGTPLTEFPVEISIGVPLVSELREQLAAISGPESAHLSDSILPTDFSSIASGARHTIDTLAEMVNAWQRTDADPDGSPVEEVISERDDILNELQACVSDLVRLREMEQDQREVPEPEHSFEARRNTLLAQTAGMIASNVYDIAVALRPVTFTTLANAEDMESWDINTLFDGRELALIDTYCEHLCRSRLTSLVPSIERGFNPLTGVPLDYPNPEQYDQAALFPHPETETLYRQVMSPEEAAETARIQRKDLRDVTDLEFQYLAERRDRLLSLSVGRERE